jgi:hypothetical protein
MKQILVTVTTRAGEHQTMLETGKPAFGREIGKGGEDANTNAPRVVAKFVSASQKKKGTATFSFANAKYEIEAPVFNERTRVRTMQSMRVLTKVTESNRIIVSKPVRFTLLKGESFRILRACDQEGNWIKVDGTFRLRFDGLVKTAVADKPKSDEESDDDGFIDDEEAVETEQDTDVVVGMARGIIAKAKDGVEVKQTTIDRSVKRMSAPMKEQDRQLKAESAKIETEQKKGKTLAAFRNLLSGK